MFVGCSICTEQCPELFTEHLRRSMPALLHCLLTNCNTPRTCGSTCFYTMLHVTELLQETLKNATLQVSEAHAAQRVARSAGGGVGSTESAPRTTHPPPPASATGVVPRAAPQPMPSSTPLPPRLSSVAGVLAERIRHRIGEMPPVLGTSRITNGELR